MTWNSGYDIKIACLPHRWAPSFLDQILAVRSGEEKLIDQKLVLFGIIITVVIVTPQLATMLTFLAYTLPTNRAISAADALTSLGLFNVLRFPLMKLGDAVTK